MKKRHILLIEDEEFLLDTIADDLVKDGYEVTKAKSGKAGIDEFKKKYYDLVITDLMMKEVSGIDVLRKIKEMSSESLVIILTGYGSLASCIEGLRLGVTDYILKPCSYTEIATKVAGCIERVSMCWQIKGDRLDLEPYGNSVGQENEKIPCPILVVTDNYAFAKTIKAHLEKTGLEVLAAFSKKDALSRLKVHQPEIALFDIGLEPKCESNFNLIDEIKRVAPSILICIAIATHNPKRFLVTALEKDVYDVIFKPFDVEQLLLSIKRCQEKLRLERLSRALECSFLDACRVLTRQFDEKSVGWSGCDLELHDKMKDIRRIKERLDYNKNQRRRLFLEKIGLTKRENEIALMSQYGYGVRDISDELGVSFFTIKTHFQNIYSKLAIHSKQELIAFLNKIH